jgi:O-antigen ligase
VNAAAVSMLLPVYLALCLVAGGASAAGHVANGLLQVAGVALACWALAAGRVARPQGRAAAPLLLLAAAAALLAIELVPLPPALWTLLPGRGVAAQGFALAGMAAPWAPLSLYPDGTLVALTALLPTAATLVLGYAASRRPRTAAAGVLVGTALAAVLLGVMQRLGGAASPLYLYAFTNRGSATGFFANSNHLATLALMALPFAAALAVEPHHRSGTRRGQVRRIALGAVAAILVVGVIAARSAAGQLLLLPVLAGAWLVFQRGERIRWRRWQVRAGIAVAALAVPLGIGVAVTANHLGAEVGAVDPFMRRVAIATTARAGLEHLPLGSGGGSMPLVYPLYEDPAAARAQFLNHAHSDYAEVLLEHGLPGVALILAALALWVACGRGLWRRGDEAAEGATLARAGFVALGAVLAHSLVDYPLRTAAIAAATAFAALAMVQPPTLAVAAAARGHRRHRARGGRRRIAVELDA